MIRVTTMASSPRPPAISRAIRRKRERGAAIFVVVLLVTMLLGIGIFASRSASLATATSGHERQMTQAQYMAEYGALLARSELDDTSSVQAWLNLAYQAKIPTECAGQDLMTSPHCVVYRYDKATTKLTAQGQNMLEPWSLGSPQIDGLFTVYMTGWYTWDSPPPGSDTTLTPYLVTVRSVGVVRLKQPDAVGWSTSTQMLRSDFITIPVARKW